MTDDVTVFVDGQPISVLAVYRREGFTELPPVPTMCGMQLLAESATEPRYTIWLEGPSDRAIGQSEAVALKDGMRFYTVPPGTYYR